MAEFVALKYTPSIVYSDNDYFKTVNMIDLQKISQWSAFGSKSLEVDFFSGDSILTRLEEIEKHCIKKASTLRTPMETNPSSAEKQDAEPKRMRN